MKGYTRIICERCGANVFDVANGTYLCAACRPRGCPRCETGQCRRHKSQDIPEKMERLLDGLLLGDGNLSGARTRPMASSAYRQSSVSHDWLNWLSDRFAEYGYRCSVYFVREYVCKSGTRSKIFYLQSTATQELSRLRRRWYPDGKKACPMDFKLTADRALQWYLGDGCFRHGGVTLCAEGFPKEQTAWLRDELCHRLGRGAARLTARRLAFNIEFTMPGSRAFLQWIGPSPVPSLAYKWGGK